MKKQDGNDKFNQISNIFSQFSEENKEKLIKTAKGLLKIQRGDITSKDETEAVKRRRLKK